MNNQQTVLRTLVGSACLAAAGLGAVSGSSRAAAPVPRPLLARLPLSFQPGQPGQPGDAAGFVSRGPGYLLQVRGNRAELRLGRRGLGAAAGRRGLRPGHRPVVSRSAGGPEAIALEFAGGSPTAAVRGETSLPGRVHLLRGCEPGAWRTGMPTYARVRSSGVYPGVDVVYYGAGDHLEYDVVVAPGADPKPVRVRFRRARRLTVEPSGDLLLHLESGVLRQQRPVAYQEQGGRRVPVRAAYRLHAAAGSELPQVGFALGEYDRSRPLVIDPVLAYSSYLGGGGGDEALGVATDPQGNIYVAGLTLSANFPVSTVAADKTANGDLDVFVSKLKPDGSALIWSTYLGGAGADLANGIAVDAQGRVTVGGTTASGNFPTTAGTVQPGYAGGAADGFAARLKPDGSGLLWSTYLGGGVSAPASLSPGEDGILGVALDGAGNVLLTGATTSTDFPLARALQANSGGGTSDVFVAKLNGDASALVYSTYLGGGDAEAGQAVAADRDGNAVVAGYTASANFPTSADGFRRTFQGGAADAFLVKLDPAGATLAYGTYLGGSLADYGWAVAVDEAGNAYLAGETDSANLPVTPTAFQKSLGGLDDLGGDGFAARLDRGLTALGYCTYLGGRAGDSVQGAALDGRALLLTGYTASADFPVRGAFQPALAAAQDPGDAFITRLAEDGSALEYSSYLGGRGFDGGRAVAVRPDRTLVAGVTEATNFPTAAALRRTLAGADDAFLAALTVQPAPAAPTGLTAAAAGAGTIELTWQDRSGNETGFEVERRGTAGPFSRLAVLPAGQSRYRDAGLPAAAGYVYRVRAFHQDAASAYSNEAAAATLPEPPAAPAELTVTALSPTSLRVDWTDASANETEFRLERRTGTGAYGTPRVLPAGSASFTDTGLQPGTIYSYRLRAANAGGVSAAVEARGATPPAAPPAPGGFSARAVSATRVDLSWTDPGTTETGYRLERQVGGGGWAVLLSLPADRVRASDVDLQPGTAYSYRLYAFNAGGDSPAAGPVTVTPAAEPKLKSFTVMPAAVRGGKPVVGAVELTAAAGAPVTVSLKSSSLRAVPPATVRVAVGQARAEITVVTKRTSRNVPVTLTATLGTDSLEAKLTLRRAKKR